MKQETSDGQFQADDNTVSVNRLVKNSHVCPSCGSSHSMEELERQDYRCSKCKLELAHLNIVNDKIVGIFGWLLPIGAVVAERFQVKDVLGKGGFGATYLVDDLRVKGKNRALKEVPAVLFDQYETSLLSRLDHPAIPDIIDHIDNKDINGMEYLVLKFGGSRTLGTERRRSPDKRIPPDRLLPWMRQLCDVLNYLHSQTPPVIHRDLKPENILLNEDDRIMLIDFGIAKEKTSDQTRALANAASESFSSPEQFYGKGTDERADIYSLGATFYALLTGMNPPGAFERMSGTALQLPSELGVPISPEVEESIIQALNLRKEDRQQTIKLFAAALEPNRPASDPTRTSPVDLGRTQPRNPTLESTQQGHANSVPLPSRPAQPHPDTLPTGETLNATQGKRLFKVLAPIAVLVALGISLPSAIKFIKGWQKDELPRSQAALNEPPPMALPVATHPPVTTVLNAQEPSVKTEKDQLFDLIPTLDNKLAISLPKANYRENEQIQLSVVLKEPGSLHIFYLKPTGEATLVFPSGFKPDNHVSGLIQIPGVTSGIKAITADPPGKYWFIAVVEPHGQNLYKKLVTDKKHEKFINLQPKELIAFLQGHQGIDNNKVGYSEIKVCSATEACH